MGDFYVVPGSWLQPGPALAVMGTKGVIQWIRDLCLPVCLAAFQINKNKIFEIIENVELK